MATKGKRRPKRYARYCISRVDDENRRTHAWVVTIQRSGKVRRRSFSDGVYAGKRKALKAAQDYRDRLLIEYPPMTRAEYANILRKNNRSGVPGVIRFRALETKNGERIERSYWIAFWPTKPGKTSRAKFSVAKYGETAAFQLAVKARKDALKELDEPYVNSAGLRAWLESQP